ncbi:MAG TPA: carboxypeptidase regulatory-like domain-containing protein [Vicinamibacterales bacterium]|nr:carboxypeptidase regulatory-like domain-containing protein [Vicinamibacterales bacterium]
MLITELFARVRSLPALGVVLGCLWMLVQPTGAATMAPVTSRIEGFVKLVASTTPAAIPSGAYPSRRVSRPAGGGPQTRHVVVYLKDAQRTEALPAGKLQIVQRDEAFEPAVAAVTRGTTVEFPNADPYFHNVFSLSRAATFDLGRYPSGDSRARMLDRAGLVKVYCHIHSHMSASILVFDHALFTIPDADGFFRLEHVPVGEHVLTAWHERIGESTKPIVVEAGRTARAEFMLPVEDR